jgi:hypothetical protein
LLAHDGERVQSAVRSSPKKTAADVSVHCGRVEKYRLTKRLDNAQTLHCRIRAYLVCPRTVQASRLAFGIQTRNSALDDEHKMRISVPEPLDPASNVALVSHLPNWGALTRVRSTLSLNRAVQPRQRYYCHQGKNRRQVARNCGSRTFRHGSCHAI